jgi:maltose alpha-D-glucosyltransferase/alpha-amylase
MQAMARLLGQRTAEVHLALSSRPDDPAFAPEPFTDFYRHGLYHALLSSVGRAFDMLRRRAPGCQEDTQHWCGRLLDRETTARDMLRQLRDQRLDALRIRIHGDLDLRQVLFTGKDFVLIDFEGDPDRPISERRIKRCPLRDVASMIRSFHYASHAVLFGQVSGVVPPREDVAPLEGWADFWYLQVSSAYLAGYLAVPGTSALLPSSRQQLRLLLDVFLLEIGMQEVCRELTRRPGWVRVPVQGMLELLETE